MSCNRQTTYDILSTFFDGVPDPNAKKEVKQDSTKLASNKNELRSLRGKKESEFVFHPPFQERACTDCHNLEEGNRLLEQPPALCFNCHDDFSENYTYLHGPVVSGNCTGCHNPHMASEKKLLERTGQDLCLYCHEQKDVFKNEAHEGIDDATCIECHNPHGGDDQYFFF